MADKGKAKAQPVKKVDGSEYSTHQGTGLDNLGIPEDIFEHVRKDVSIFSAIDTIAAVKITDKDKKSTVAVGLRADFDQTDLNITAVKLPDGKNLFFEKPVVVEFDKETDEKKGLVKGAITEKSARELSDAVKNYPDVKKHPNVQKNPKDLVAEIENSPKFPVASVDSHSAPLTFAGKTSKSEQGLA